MDEKNWRSLYFEIKWLSKLASLKSLAFGWLGLNLLQYYFYGVAGWDRHWNIKPEIWNHVEAFWELSLSHYVGWIVLAAVLDFFFWPYFGRREVKLRFD